MISRSHVIGLVLAVGLMVAGGTGIAVADSTPTPTAPTKVPTVCTVNPAPGASGQASIAKCAAALRGAIPKGAPGTGGGGMAVEVGSWA